MLAFLVTMHSGAVVLRSVLPHRQLILVFELLGGLLQSGAAGAILLDPRDLQYSIEA